MTTYRAGSNAPGTALHRIRGALPKPLYTCNNPTGAVTWSDGGAGGTFAPSGVNNQNAIYTPKNKTQAVVISATDPANTKTIALTVFATVPVQPQFGFDVESDIETAIKFAKDRTRYFREDGDLEIGWVLAWDARPRDEFEELRQFWRDHRKINQLYMVDAESNILNKVWFTSSMKWVPAGANRFNLVASFRGVDEFIEATTAEPLALKINCGGYAAGVYVPDQFYTNGYTWYYGAITPDTSGVTNPAPDEVYRWVRYEAADISYHITGLRANHPHDIRLHFIADTARTVTPKIQGVSKPNVNVASSYVAIASSYLAINSDNEGNIDIVVTKVSGTNAVLSAIEVTENA